MYFGQAFAVDLQCFRSLSFEMNRQYYATRGAPADMEYDTPIVG
jgi:hypothetical protein